VQCSCNKVKPNIILYTKITFKYDININMSISGSDEEYLHNSLLVPGVSRSTPIEPWH